MVNKISGYTDFLIASGKVPFKRIIFEVVQEQLLLDNQCSTVQHNLLETSNYITIQYLYIYANIQFFNLKQALKSFSRLDVLKPNLDIATLKVIYASYPLKSKCHQWTPK